MLHLSSESMREMIPGCSVVHSADTKKPQGHCTKNKQINEAGENTWNITASEVEQHLLTQVFPALFTVHFCQRDQEHGRTTPAPCLSSRLSITQTCHLIEHFYQTIRC